MRPERIATHNFKEYQTMNTQTVAHSTKDALESTRGTLINFIRAGHGSTRGALKACDQMTKTSVDMLAGVPTVVSTTLRDGVVSIEGQLTMIAGMLTESATASAEEVANRTVQAASGAVDGFERVFDKRVMDALARAGAPSSALIRELAQRVATIARDVALLSDLLQPQSSEGVADKVATPAARTRVKPRNSGRVAKRGKKSA
jgi:hypothetical protein